MEVSEHSFFRFLNNKLTPHHLVCEVISKNNQRAAFSLSNNHVASCLSYMSKIYLGVGTVHMHFIAKREILFGL